MSKAIVLVVEDEAILRFNAILMIEEAGYEVVEATNADEAIQILESRTDIRVVFTDINMPGTMDGIKLANAVRNRWPPVRLILASGKMTLREGDIPADGRFLAKPYTSQQLARVLAEVTT